MELPPSLARRIALFRINGTIPEHVDPLFRSVSWQALMDGLGVRPRAHHPAIDRVAAGEVNRELGAMAEALAGFVATLPAHEAFLARHCPAPAPKPSRNHRNNQWDARRASPSRSGLSPPRTVCRGKQCRAADRKGEGEGKGG